MHQMWCELQKRENRSCAIAVYLNLEDKCMAFYTMYKLNILCCYYVLFGFAYTLMVVQRKIEL